MIKSNVFFCFCKFLTFLVPEKKLLNFLYSFPFVDKKKCVSVCVGVEVMNVRLCCSIYLFSLSLPFLPFLPLYRSDDFFLFDLSLDFIEFPKFAFSFDDLINWFLSFGVFVVRWNFRKIDAHNQPNFVYPLPSSLYCSLFISFHFLTKWHQQQQQQKTTINE